MFDQCEAVSLSVFCGLKRHIAQIEEIDLPIIDSPQCLKVWGVEPVVTHQTSRVNSTGVWNHIFVQTFKPLTATMTLQADLPLAGFSAQTPSHLP